MALEDTDLFLVNRDDKTYTQQRADIMAQLEDTDYLLVNREDKTYKITGAEFKGSFAGTIVTSPSISSSSSFAPSTVTATPAVVTNATQDASYINWYLDGNPISGTENTLEITATVGGVYKYEERWVDGGGNDILPNAQVTVDYAPIAKPTVLAPADGAGQGSAVTAIPKTGNAISSEELKDNYVYGNIVNYFDPIEDGGLWTQFSKDSDSGLYTVVRGGYSDNQKTIIQGVYPLGNLSEVNGTSDKELFTDCYAIDDSQSMWNLGICISGVSDTTYYPGQDPTTSLGWTFDEKENYIFTRNSSGSTVLYLTHSFTRYDYWEIELDYGNKLLKLYHNGTHLPALDITLISMPLVNVLPFSCVEPSVANDFCVGMGKRPKKLTYSGTILDSKNDEVMDGVTLLDCFKQGNAVDFNYYTGDYTSGNVIGDVTSTQLIVNDRAFNPTNTYTVNDNAAWRGVANNGTRCVACSEEGYIQYSDDGINWSQEGSNARLFTKTDGSPIKYQDVAYADGRFIVVGSGPPQVYSSVDGVTWTIKALPTQGQDNYALKAVAYGAGRWVVVGNDNPNIYENIFWSSDGENWNVVNANSQGLQAMYSLEFANGIFMAGSWGENNNISTSPDGVTWTKYATPVTGSDTLGGPDMNGTAFSPELNRWVAVADTGENRIWYSENNGSSWSPAQLGTYYPHPFYNVEWAGKMFVACGYNTSPASNRTEGGIYYSKDGFIWEYTQFIGCGGTDLTFIPTTGQLVGVNNGNNPGYGRGWYGYLYEPEIELTNQFAQSRKILSSAGPNPGSLQFVGSIPEAVTEGSINTWGDATWTVTDVIANTTQTATKAITPNENQTYGPGGDINLNVGTVYDVTVTYDSPVGQPATSDSNRFKTSSVDGWVPIASADDINLWKAVTYGKDKFVAVSEEDAERGTSVMYSADGLTWTSGSIESNKWADVAYGNDLYILVGTNYATTQDKIAYSTDGETYLLATGVDNTFNGLCSCVAFGEGRFVALTDNRTGSGIYTDDGNNWSSVTFSTPSNDNQQEWVDMAYGNGRFVAISSGTSGEIWASYSSNGGTEWTSVRVTTIDNNFKPRAIAFGQGKFYTVGLNTSGAVAFYWSSDGQDNWQAASVPKGSDWTGITFGGNYWVAVTKTGPVNQVAVSEDGFNWELAGTGSTEVGLMDVCYGDGKYVAVARTLGEDGKKVLYSEQPASEIPTLFNETYESKYYDSNNLKAVYGYDISNTFGIEPDSTTARYLGFSSLTEQPTYDVAGYELQTGYVYKPIPSLVGEVERLTTELAKAHQTISTLESP